MPMMARMRTLAPAFIITVGVLFVLFMIISDSRVLEIMGARSNNVGSVNGREITYQEFNNFVDRAKENQKQQTGQDVDEESMDQFREQVWDALVTQYLTEEALKKNGITVSDQEIQEMILGENPPDFLKRNFMDSTGRFNREAYEGALRDPRNKEALIQAEDYVRQQILNEKLQSMLSASITISEQDIKRRFIDQTSKMTADYVLVDVNSFPDSTVSVSDNDLQKYYNDNPDKFKQEDQRKLKYVLFSIKPSHQDSQSVFTNLKNVYEKAKDDTADFESYVKIYSESPYSKDTLDMQGLAPELAERINQIASNTLVGPVPISTGYALFKLGAVLPGKTEYVRAQHILVSGGDDAANLTEANRLYDELSKGANFSEYAKQYSKDPGSASKGGDLGWFGKGRMVPEFETACFKGGINQVQKPVKTNYGYHIIKVTGRSSNRYVVEKITQAVKASAATRDRIMQAANDFAYLAEKNGFEKEATTAKYDIQETTPFTEDVFSVPGLGFNKGIIKFAFNNSVNTASQSYRLGTGYAVVMVSEVIKPGVKKLDDVKKEVRAYVLREKKFERSKNMISDLKNKIGGDLTKAPSINSLAQFGTAADFSTSGSVPNVGMDYGFSSAAYELPLNSISSPVKGNKGYYLILVKQRSGFDQAAYQVQRNSIRDNILQEKKSVYYQQWIAKLKDEADIVDNRDLFYGR